MVNLDTHEQTVALPKFKKSAQREIFRELENMLDTFMKVQTEMYCSLLDISQTLVKDMFKRPGH